MPPKNGRLVRKFQQNERGPAAPEDPVQRILPAAQPGMMVTSTSAIRAPFHVAQDGQEPVHVPAAMKRVQHRAVSLRCSRDRIWTPVIQEMIQLAIREGRAWKKGILPGFPPSTDNVIAVRLASSLGMSRDRFAVGVHQDETFPGHDRCRRQWRRSGRNAGATGPERRWFRAMFSSTPGAVAAAVVAINDLVERPVV